MNYFLDTEFSHLPWEDQVQLISIGIVDENGKSYYACLDNFDQNNVSTFVWENVIQFLPRKSKRKSCKQVKQELVDFFGENIPSNFWCVFPTKKQLESFSINKKDINSVLKKFGDFDFQLMKKIFGNDYPEHWPKKGSNLTPLYSALSKNNIPTNNKEHDALADALWNKKIWETAMINSR